MELLKLMNLRQKLEETYMVVYAKCERYEP